MFCNCKRCPLCCRSSKNVDIYYAMASPPSRMVLVAAKALGVKLQENVIDMAKGEHLKPEFLKMNPQHTVPTIVDNSLILNESRAIITYLADKYGKDDSLFPKDVKKRAVVNQRLYFDAGTLYQRFADLYFPVFFGGASMDTEKQKKLDEAYSILDTFLAKTKCVAGDSYTLADISVAVSVSFAEVVGYNVNKFSNVAAWLAKVKTSLPGYDVMPKGLEAFKGMVDFLTKSQPKAGVKLYYAMASPPSRVVLVAAQALGVPLEHNVVDMMKGEHLTPEFLKMNPQHTVPTMVDNDLILSESRGIITYLADNYAKDESLYPKDLKRRAVINQRLYFDAGTLYQRFGDLYFPVIFGGAPLDSEKKTKLDEAFTILDTFLDRTKCVAGETYTLADISVGVTVSCAEVVGYEVNKYPNVAAWLKKVKTSLPGYDVMQKGAEAFKGMFDALTKK